MDKYQSNKYQVSIEQVSSIILVRALMIRTLTTTFALRPIAPHPSAFSTCTGVIRHRFQDESALPHVTWSNDGKLEPHLTRPVFRYCVSRAGSLPVSRAGVVAMALVHPHPRLKPKGKARLAMPGSSLRDHAPFGVAGSAYAFFFAVSASGGGGSGGTYPPEKPPPPVLALAPPGWGTVPSSSLGAGVVLGSGVGVVAMGISSAASAASLE